MSSDNSEDKEAENFAKCVEELLENQVLLTFKNDCREINFHPKSYPEILKHKVGVQNQREKTYQRILEYFLNPLAPHGFESMILKIFLELIEEETDFEFDSESKLSNCEIVTEYTYRIPEDHDEEESGRLDLLILEERAEPDWAIVLELKVDAPEGESQTITQAKLADQSYDSKGNFNARLNKIENCHFVFVTKEKTKPKDERFKNITWEDIEKHFREELSNKFNSGKDDLCFEKQDVRSQNKIFKGYTESNLDIPMQSLLQFLDFLMSLREVSNIMKTNEEKFAKCYARLHGQSLLDSSYNFENFLKDLRRSREEFSKYFEDELLNGWKTKIKEKIEELEDLEIKGDFEKINKDIYKFVPDIEESSNWYIGTQGSSGYGKIFKEGWARTGTGERVVPGEEKWDERAHCIYFQNRIGSRNDLPERFLNYGVVVVLRVRKADTTKEFNKKFEKELRDIKCDYWEETDSEAPLNANYNPRYIATNEIELLENINFSEDLETEYYEKLARVISRIITDQDLIQKIDECFQVAVETVIP